MIKRKMRMHSLFAFLAFTLLFVSPAFAALTCDVSPEVVPINLKYNGATLNVTGQSKAGDDLIIRITNENADAHYRYIGKAGGVVWMKKGDISYKNVPGVYMLYSSKELELLLSDAEQKKNLIGYDALKEASEIETENEELLKDTERWQNEFIRFKENEKLYSIHTGTVTREHGQDSDSFQVEVALPYQASVGSYMVEALAVRDGKIVDKAQTTFVIERAGLVEKLTDLAFNHAALYGLMAVVIAIVAGFAVGIIFKGGGGGAH